VAGPEAKQRLFEEVVAANQRRIVAIARSYAPSNERQDLCQEILLQMWKGLDGFKGKSTPSTWVYRVALNTAITFRRKKGRQIGPSVSLLDDCGDDLAAPASIGNEILILEDFLRSLGKIDRAVFLLYLEDLSYREISEVTGLTESHVGVRINRLKKTFVQRYCGGCLWSSKDSNRHGKGGL
jgi:RNA polymerase sigma-70 factor (ECF subfamily)